MKALLFPVVHLHVHVDMARKLRKLYPSKKIIVHWHGEELRQRGWEGVREITSVSDAVFVSTEDLLAGAPEGVVHLPNPVDMELFRPIPSLRKPNSALYIVKGYRGEDLEWPKKVTSKLGLELDVRDRKVGPISYNEMPMLLNRYEYYVDRNYPESLSKTALEALACGVKVISWKEEILTSLPSEHDPKNVVQQFISTLKKRSFNEILGSLT
jgi:glycosyltransferase involved in cell wall biosynthesis